jgi:hypothetical protein
MKPIEIDAFNGDADGLFAAHQLRLAEPGAEPAAVRIVTGLKREIALLERIELPAEDAARLQLRVFDISLARNRTALERLLAQGAHVRWFDHHHAGQPPVHPHLQVHIDTSADTCTSVLVDRELEGRYRRWAVAAAFGDNLAQVGRALADTLALDEAEVALLRELGEAVNYNGYGEADDDVLITPAALYARLAGHVDPLDFARDDPLVPRLAAQRRSDLAAAMQLAPRHESAAGAVYVLPDAPWSRRVLGSFANLLAERAAAAAFAVLKARDDGSFTASVRAPLAAPAGADALCRRFGGDGRAGAAGIDHLPAERLDEFAQSFARHAWGR